jgi:branched-chain amino acid transport system permease protein
MSSVNVKKWLKLLGAVFVLSELTAVITGPPGNPTHPWVGFHGSIVDQASFLGLFNIQRWIAFFVYGLIVSGVVYVFRTQKQFIAQVRTAQRTVTSNKAVKVSTSIATIVLVVLLPTLVADPFWQNAMVSQIAVYVLLALGLNVVVGFAGLLDLGFVAFYAVGAYATAWCTGALPLPALFGVHLNTFYAIPIAIILAMVSGIILGIPTLRLRGDYLAIVTLGFGEIITLFANNLNGITGGAMGTAQIPHFSVHVGPVNYVWGIPPVPYYYLTIAFVGIFIVAFSLLEPSRVGRAWTAIREDEVAAESVGINPLKYKVMAFAIGAASAGFAGVMTAAQTNYVTPATFTLALSINILVLVIFGGMGSILGVVFGAVVIQTITMYLIHNPPAGYQPQDLYIYIGALLVIMMIFRPAGMIPARRRSRAITSADSSEA